ncbi:hypothetical protein ACGFJT_36885 [Actinomadura geliboluensis]|uniref:hypothetical protein n=1 Tax=Actinomadura geliboluensis TaxID=882440 RepID=UPI0037152BE8
MNDPASARPGAGLARPPLAVGAALAAALSGFRATAPRRQPAEVTADRLGDQLDRWPDRFNGTGQTRPGRSAGGQKLMDARQERGAGLRFLERKR